jgi:hypothetical protein
LTVKQGELSGVPIVKAKLLIGAGSYELQISEGDISNEESWKFHGAKGEGYCRQNSPLY